MNVREKGERVNIMIRERKGFIEDILIIVNDKNGEFTLVNIAGKFTMEDINKMIHDVEFNNVIKTE